jgi:phosphoribosylanthranilate isomerase
LSGFKFILPRPRVKICGITSNQDAQRAAILGADAIGLNFYSGSPRAITCAQVPSILHKLPAFTTVVGLLVDPTEAEVQTVLGTGLVNCLQFHGNESPAFCQSFGMPYIKAIRVNDFDQTKSILDDFADCSTVILDTYVKDLAGGTGEKFDWSIASRLVAENSKQIILAGGLNAENIGSAIRAVRPYGVDVSSGVELKPGLKDPVKMEAFFSAVQQHSI